MHIKAGDEEAFWIDALFIDGERTDRCIEFDDEAGWAELLTEEWDYENDRPITVRKYGVKITFTRRDA